MSARELMLEMRQARETGIRQVERPVSRRNPIADHLPEDVRRKLEWLRRQK